MDLLRLNTQKGAKTALLTPKRYQDSVLCVWLEIEHKSSHCGPFEAEHPESYQNRFLAPNRFDEHARHFYIGPKPVKG